MLTSRLAGCFLTALIFLFVLLVSRDHYAFIIDTSDGNKISATDPSPPEPVVQQQQQQQEYRSDVELVVASTAQEDTSWLERYLPEWRAHRYVVNNASAPLTVPANKGREAMVYLTHIIDAYEELPPNLVFVHASRFAWHNDDPDYDALPALRNLRLPHLREAGYVNLRCVWVIGCPSEIRPVEDEGHTNDGAPSAKGVYKQAWGELMPGAPPVPDVVAVGCCSQFAVTRETIQSRPIEDYLRFRDWLLATPLDDSLSGRIFEFSWHSKFAHIPTYYFLPLQRNQICDLVGYFSFFFVLLLTVDSYFR